MTSLRGWFANKDRYGIESCPCRLFIGTAEENLDIVCPCVYRDDDLAEYGACFCALYVTGNEAHRQTPERRPPLEERRKNAQSPVESNDAPVSLPYPVYRCGVCGYLCANNHPPRVCPDLQSRQRAVCAVHVMRKCAAKGNIPLLEEYHEKICVVCVSG